VSLKEKEMGLNRDVLENKDALMRYPILEEFSASVLYQKALALQRSMPDIAVTVACRVM